MKIEVNGQSYDDWSQVPEPLRQQLSETLPDDDHDGVPDLFQGRLPATAPGSHTFTSTTIDVGGTTYTSLDQVPPEIRALLQQALGGGAAPAAPGPGAAPAATPGAKPAPAPAVDPQASPHQVILNGQPVVVDDDGVAAPPKRGLLRRLLGG